MTTCSNCKNEVPREPFCVRCGAPLENAGSHYHERRGYAAAPHEHWYHPRIVSSLFPQLPRADMLPFRLSLAGGVGIVVALCLLRLFPLGLISAAVLVPLLFLLYVWEVDLYEEEPGTVLGFTVAWGLLGGVALGLVARHVSSEVSLVQGKANTHDVIWLGVILPCIALVVMIGGPLVLLPYRNFNDVLDGAAFGGVSAVTLVAAEAITNSSGFLQHGFRAAGQNELWIARLLTLGVALPLLAAGVAGASTGTFWLRFRARSVDRRALGPLGSPFLAVPIAAGALVGSYLSAIYLGQWTTLVITAALAALSLVWLRWMIHVGLCEEAGDPIGSPIVCPNCHHETPVHSFCGHCGVSLRALPGHGRAHVGRTPPKTHLGLTVKLTIFACVVGAAIGLGAVAIVLSRPSQTKPPCEPGVPCVAPPTGSPVPAPHVIAGGGIFEAGTSWKSDLGPEVWYQSNWETVTSNSRTLIVKAESDNGLFFAVAVIVDPSSLAATAALDDQVSSETRDYLGVQRDTSAKDVILSPEIGFVHGISAVYKATVDQPPSPSQQVAIAFAAATHGKATIVIEAITNDQADSSSASSPFPALEAVDEMLDSFQWTPGS